MCPIQDRAQQEKADRAKKLKDLATERANRVAARAAKASASPTRKRTYNDEDDEGSNYERTQRSLKKCKDDISSMGTKRKSTDDYEEDDDVIVADSDDERPSKRSKKGSATADMGDKPKKAKDEKLKPKNKHEKALIKFKNKMKTTNLLGGGLFAQRREEDVFLAGRRKEIEKQAVQHGATAEVKKRAQAIDKDRKQALGKFGGLFGGMPGGAKKKAKSEAERKTLVLNEERKIAKMKAERTMATKEQEAERAEQRRIQEFEELQKEFHVAPVARAAETALPSAANEEDEFAYLFESAKREAAKPAPVAQMTAAEVVTPPGESTDESFEGASTSTPKMSDDGSPATSPTAVAPAAQMIQPEHYTPPASPELAPAKDDVESKIPQTSSRVRRRVAPTRISEATRKEVEGAS